MSMYERIGYMRRFMTLDELRRYKWSVENEIAKWESRLAGPRPRGSCREELRFNQMILRKIEKVIAEKETRTKEAVE